jgi:type IV pilus assembly protein PilB
MESELLFDDVLLQILHDQGLLRDDQIETLLADQEESAKSARDLVVDLEFMEEDEVLEIIAGYLGTQVINLPATEIPPDILHSIPASTARMYNVIPVDMTAESITLATSDLVTQAILEELRFVLTREVGFVLAREEDVRTCVNQYYGDTSESVNDMLSSLEEDFERATAGDGADLDEEGIEEAAGSTPVIRFVNLVLYQAIQDRASDIHFEPFENEFKIRYRVDGSLYEMTPPPKRLAGPVTSRIKVMANMNIAERRLPQDGRINLTVAGRMIDLRVSTLPTQSGLESCVLRVLDRSTVQLDLENLGIPEDVYHTFSVDIEKPNGIIIVTGPTGSGKTTTLYSALMRINTVECKLLTCEEPVEYDIEGIMQVPISEATGNTFPIVLRAFLRQDPDVMMVGEIRDLETAQIAIQASLTGHLVFSTLHTNDAAGSVTRLIDMGVEPYLASSTLEAIVGQRLLRVICDRCKTGYSPDITILEQLEITADEVGDREFQYGSGCAHCSNTGYRGRRGIYEYLSVTDPIRELINDRSPTLVIREKARELGMRTLREDGVRNILDGYTTVDEVMRYT